MVAIPDLGVLALCGLALAFLLTFKAFATALYNVLNVGIAGVHPFAGAAVSLERNLIGWLNGAIAGTEKVMARFWNEIAASFVLAFDGALRIGDGVVTGISYLWNHALPAFVKLQTDVIGAVARKAETIATGNAATIAHDLTIAENYAEAQAGRALSEARTFTTAHVADAVSSLRSEFAGGLAMLQRAESDALTSGLQTVQAGITAAERLAVDEAARLSGELTGDVTALEKTIAATAQSVVQSGQAGVAEAERLAGSALAQSEAAARQALAEAEARGKAALDVVGGIAGTIGSDLKTVEGAIGAAGAAGLIAAIPALATLVHAIATEAGLDSSSCRAKNKQICGTDPLQWAGLLGGLALMGGALSLRELVPVARVIAHGTEDLIRAAA